MIVLVPLAFFSGYTAISFFQVFNPHYLLHRDLAILQTVPHRRLNFQDFSPFRAYAGRALVLFLTIFLIVINKTVLFMNIIKRSILSYLILIFFIEMPKITD